MNIDELLSIDFKRVNDAKSMLSILEKEAIHKEFFKITGERRSEGCGACYIEMFIKIKNYYKNNMSNNRYVLKKGIVLQAHGEPNVYTNINMTDAVAVRFLKRSLGNLKHFEKYPEDWEKEVKGYDLKKEIERNQNDLKNELKKAKQTIKKVKGESDSNKGNKEN